tara:strand:+ start:595 stop:1947 length:1353 start_codon:yes stop_codon:yes gene_type:complete
MANYELNNRFSPLQWSEEEENIFSENETEVTVVNDLETKQDEYYHNNFGSPRVSPIGSPIVFGEFAGDMCDDLPLESLFDEVEGNWGDIMMEEDEKDLSNIMYDEEELKEKEAEEEEEEAEEKVQEPVQEEEEEADSTVSVEESAQDLVLDESVEGRPRGNSFTTIDDLSVSKKYDSEISEKSDSEVSDNESSNESVEEDVPDLIKQAMDSPRPVETPEVRLLKEKIRTLEGVVENRTTTIRNLVKKRKHVSGKGERSFRRRLIKAPVLRYDEDGELQTGGNYVKEDESDEYSDVKWSPPFGASFDGMFYCHDPDCKRSFCSPRSLKCHIWLAGNKYRENHDRFGNGRSGHNAENDETEKYLMIRDEREFIRAGWDPRTYCTKCGHGELHRCNMKRHMIREHIKLSDKPEYMSDKEWIEEEMKILLPKKKRGNFRQESYVEVLSDGSVRM